ncbi:hypothetical protein AMECASPLE_006278 [Ameca splendens]|uniref:Uncharacterized protein n=1 Tax=Ameca splendens TaxID=208324 RepID=A0ABV0YAD7_9TELE
MTTIYKKDFYYRRFVAFKIMGKRCAADTRGFNAKGREAKAIKGDCQRNWLFGEKVQCKGKVWLEKKTGITETLREDCEAKPRVWGRFTRHFHIPCVKPLLNYR